LNEPSAASAEQQKQTLLTARNLVLATFLLLGAVIVRGCMTTSTPVLRSSGSASVPMNDDLFAAASDTLDRLHEYNTFEALGQIVDRFNRWVRQHPRDDAWQLDPLVETLPREPDDLKSILLLRTAGDYRLNTNRQHTDDQYHFLEATWMRNIAGIARGDQSDDLARAVRLFDWTVRHLQLEKDPPPDSPQFDLLPWENLVLGRATAAHRAWVFTLLCRQQNLDVAMLAIPDAKQPGGLRLWTAALCKDNQLYLFDPRLGIPLPGPSGQGVATLEQVAADDALLRPLDLPKFKYPVTSDDAKRVVAWVEGSPHYLSRRMELIGSRLAGERRVVLAASPSATAERLKQCKHVSDVRLWPLPYQVHRRREQAAGPARLEYDRNMMVLTIPLPKPKRPDSDQGVKEDLQGAEGAMTHRFGEGRRRATVQENHTLWGGRVLQFKGILKPTGDHTRECAQSHYLSFLLPQSDIDKMLDQITQATASIDPQQSAGMRTAFEKALPLAKQNANYWLGLIAFDRGEREPDQYEVAATWFNKCSFETTVDGPWIDGADYNLARTHEVLYELALKAGDKDKAAEHLKKALKLYDEDESPQRHGNHLRGKWLREKAHGHSGAG
jgi:hypothetical protein